MRFDAIRQVLALWPYTANASMLRQVQNFMDVGAEVRSLPIDEGRVGVIILPRQEETRRAAERGVVCAAPEVLVLQARDDGCYHRWIEVVFHPLPILLLFVREMDGVVPHRPALDPVQASIEQASGLCRVHEAGEGGVVGARRRHVDLRKTPSRQSTRMAQHTCDSIVGYVALESLHWLEVLDCAHIRQASSNATSMSTETASSDSLSVLPDEIAETAVYGAKAPDFWAGELVEDVEEQLWWQAGEATGRDAAMDCTHDAELRSVALHDGMVEAQAQRQSIGVTGHGGEADGRVAKVVVEALCVIEAASKRAVGERE